MTQTQRAVWTVMIFGSFLTLGLLPLQWLLAVVMTLALCWGLYCTLPGGEDGTIQQE